MTIDVDRLLADHPLASILARCGIQIPRPDARTRDQWRCHCPLPSHPAPADPARHKPSFTAHLQGPMAGRWHCFACQTGGDGVQLVEAYAQVGFLDAVKLIQAGGAIPRGADPHLHLRPATRTPTGGLAWPARPGSDREQPDPFRTSKTRLADAMAEAWRYYSLDILAGLARRRFTERHIDLTALEASEGRILAGHTPKSTTGLVDHLHKRCFGDDELVDAGLANRRPDGRIEDFFAHRLILPVRNLQGPVIGLIGRDVSGGERAKYLNSPNTAIYNKSRHLYRPRRHTGLGADNLVVVEGPLDALAVDAYAAQARLDIVAITPSGVALTAAHRVSLALQAAKPPVLCADGDNAGRAATVRWVTDMTLDGHEVVAVTLPDPDDPADWLAKHGPAGLTAFVRQGCLDARPSEVRPVHAGRFLADQAVTERRELAETFTALGRLGARLRSHAGQRRFADQAGRGLAAAGLGPDGWLERAVAAHLDDAFGGGVEPEPGRSGTWIAV